MKTAGQRRPQLVPVPPPDGKPKRPEIKHKGLEPYYCTDGKWRWKVRIAGPDGRMLRSELFNTVKEALEEQTILRHQVYQVRKGRETELVPERKIDAEIDAYLLTTSKKRDARNERYLGNWWKAFFKEEGIGLLHQIKPEKLERARHQLHAKGLSAARINRYTDWLRHVLNLAKRQDRFRGENPAGQIDRYQENPAPIHRYTEAQEEALAKKLGPYYTDWLRFGILTNMRQGNQCRLAWTDVNWDDGLILLGYTKNGKPRYVVMTEEVKRILKRLREVNPNCPWVFPNPSRTNHANGRNFYQRVFEPSRDAAGLPKHLKWHTLRHTFGSRLAELGWNPKDIMEFGGWTDIRAAQRYIHYQSVRLKEIGESLSRPFRTVKSLPHEKRPPKRPRK